MVYCHNCGRFIHDLLPIKDSETCWKCKLECKSFYKEKTCENKKEEESTSSNTKKPRRQKHKKELA